MRDSQCTPAVKKVREPASRPDRREGDKTLSRPRDTTRVCEELGTVAGKSQEGQCGQSEQLLAMDHPITRS